jgi:RNA polymerase primary sigma factor
MSMRQLKITKSITNRESQSLEKYLQEIGRVDLITAEEEVILAVKIKQGDQVALDRLTKANLRFVVSVAKQYQNQGLSLSDLINEGNLGLIKAAQRFDETRGFKFISYAVWWIRQSILQSLAEQSRIVRLPLNKVGLTNKINKAYSQLEQEFEREPSAEELSKLLEIPTEEIEATLSSSSRHLSMDAPFSEGEDGSMMDVYRNPNAESADSNIEHNESLKDEIERSLSILTIRQKEVLVNFFGIGVDNPLSLEDIGERFGLTRERVRQIKDKAILKLRTTGRSKLLKNYLGV